MLDVTSNKRTEQRYAVERAKKIVQQSKNMDKVEFVIRGDGVSFVFANSPYKSDIKYLIESGVIFTVCENSIQSVMRKGNMEEQIVEGVKFVENANNYSEKLKENGYIDEFA